MRSRGLPPRLLTSEERELQPLPAAIDIREFDFPEPAELCLHVEQPFGRVFLIRGETQSAEETLVQAYSRRRDVLMIAENAVRFE